MRTCRIFLAFVLASITVTFAQAQGYRPAEDKGQATLPYTPGLDVPSMDRSADPCVDFYQFSCGGWKKTNPIPPDQTSWSVYGKLYQDNVMFLRGILETAALTKSMTGSVDQEIGDFYAACMDEAAVEKRGLAAIQPQLQAVNRLKSVHDLAPVLARLQLETPDTSLIFGGGSTQDPDDAEQQIAGFDQGGLGLPDRDYYTRDDAKSKENREKYVLHVQKIFELLGDKPEVAKKNADTVMRMETEMAKASLTRVERRDPYKLKNKMKVPELEKLAPNFDWQTYFRAVSTPKFEILNVTAPAFFKEINLMLAQEPLDNWKTYLRFHVGNGYAPYLQAAFVQENFDFYRKYLRGAKEMQPRWKRCVQLVDRELGEALGKAYVRKVFSPQLKGSTLDMVKRIEDAMALRIRELDWMSPETKQQAMTKLNAIRNKIGYPDKWRDYSSVKITRDDFAGNVTRATEFEAHRDINKIGTPIDRGEWGMSPPTVNAYYNPQMNDINFPAGVLQPPLYDAKMDAAPNYGNTGGTIGHELTHGFDDEGSQFDAKGNLKDWWTKEDKAKFEERTKCVSDQYAQYIAIDDIHINSKLTLGEDVADLGGEILAYIAWKDATKNQSLKNADDLTPDQRFFVGFAQWACANERPEDQRVRALTDEHSPPKYRINGVVVNMPQFQEAFSCKAGQPMVRENRCRVW
ncbi:MAG TPA: M13 family metallopeptidase [Alphaproteobacteria bacterium]|nr:M13 family metallopeptidase [Alphaproteobacteria bacterium]